MSKLRLGAIRVMRPLFVLAVSAIAGVLTTLPVRPAAAQTARPNVVLLFSDDAGYADWGFMQQYTGESTQFKTPRLDQLAQESVLFTNAYVAAPLCSPSRSGMLTGMSPSRFGAEYNFGDTLQPWDGVPTDQLLLPERMKQLGYDTGVVGKWHLGVASQFQPYNQGVDEFYGFLQGARSYFTNVIAQPSIRRGFTSIPWETEPSFNNVAPDPVKGRYLTDAFGDEASKFIANHASDADPFFLYVPFNGPHTPVNEAKAQDLAEFSSSSLLGDRKNVAALSYGMDRNIGAILDRIDDPNRDGNTSDSIRDNTIVIFLNDNGGSIPAGSFELYDNGPLRDYKGSMYEGGTRVPMMIRAPGVDPQVVHEMVSSLDLFPTIVAAAGGEQTTYTDGVNLAPVLAGQQQGPIHQSLSWKLGVDGFAVRKGNWKLVKGRSSSLIELFQLNNDGSGENIDLFTQNPEKVAELVNEFLAWETQQDKLRNTQQSFIQVSRFDEFRQRNDLTTAFNWQWAGGWLNNADLGVSTKLQRYDGVPNTVLVFDTRDDASYTSQNNLGGRATSQLTTLGRQGPKGMVEFMLNEIRLQGDFNGVADRSGQLFGQSLMFVDSLTGRAPRISLDANRSASNDFAFRVDMDLVLYDELLLVGNGTGSFSIGGGISDIAGPRGITKQGTSAVTLAGASSFGGELRVEQGLVRIAGVNAAVSGASAVRVSPAGTLRLESGLVRTATVDVSAGGTFDFRGGTLEVTGAGSQFGPGRLDVGKLTAAQLTMGPGSAGATADLRLGAGAAGALLLQAGSSLTTNGMAEIGAVAAAPLSQATVAGGQWTLAGPLLVGAGGAGSLQIRDGGLVAAQQEVALGAVAGIHGQASVGVDGAGTLQTPSLALGGTASAAAGTGELIIGPQGLVDVDGVAQVWGGGVLRLQGGTLELAQLQLAPGGQFDWQSGTVRVPGEQGLAVGPAGPLGATVDLTAGRILSTPGALRVLPGGTFTLGGGLLQATNATLDGGTVNVSNIDNVGVLRFNSGVLNITGGDTVIAAGNVTGTAGAVIIGVGGELGSAVVLNAGDELHDTGVTLLPTGGSLVLNGGVFTTDILRIDGGSLTGPAFPGVGSLEFLAGSITITGDLNVVAGGPLGATLAVGAGQTVASQAALNMGLGSDPGSLSISTGGVVTAVGAATVRQAGTLTLSGGRLQAASLAVEAGGVFDWQSGTVRLTDPATITAGGLFNGAANLTANQQLELVGLATIGQAAAAGSLTIGAGSVVVAEGGVAVEAQGTLTLAGGTLRTESLARVAGSVFDWQTGTLSWQGDLAIDPNGPLGAAVALSAGQNLQTTGALLVGSASGAGTLAIGAGGGADAIGALTIDGAGSVVTVAAGGALSTASIALANGGVFDWQGGAVAITGPGGVAIDAGSPLGTALVLNSDKSLAVTATASVDAGGSLTASAGSFSAGALAINGGAVTVADFDDIGAVSFAAGNLAVTGPAGASLGVGSPLGTSLSLNAGRTLAATTKLSVGEGASLAAVDDALSTALLEVAGGTAALDDLSGVDAVSLTGGTLHVSSPTGVSFGPGGPLPASLTLPAGATLMLDGPATIAVGAHVVVAGGQFSSAGAVLDGGSLTVPSLDGLGAVTMNSGSLAVDGPTGITISGSSPLGPAVTVDAGKSLAVTATTTVGAGGSLAVTGGDFSTGVLIVDGGSFTATSLAQVGAVDFRSGMLSLAGSDELVVGPGSPLGAEVELLTGDSLQTGGGVTILAGGTVRRDGGTLSSTSLSIAGGRYAAADLSGVGPINFLVGALELSGDQMLSAAGDVAQALGGSLQVGVGRELKIDGAATLLAPLSIAGGKFSTGSLTNAALLNFDAGTLEITGGDVVVGAGGLFGNQLHLLSGRRLEVDAHALHVTSTSILMVDDDATATATTLAIDAQGEVVLDGLTAALEAATLTNAGVLRGQGRVTGPVVNAAGGEVIAGAGQRLRFLGPTFQNAGRVSALGTVADPAVAEFEGAATNAAGATITGANARLRLLGGVVNAGSLSLTNGENHVFGHIANASGGEVLVTGGAVATFYDDVQNDGEIRVSQIGEATSRAIFLGMVSGAGGSSGGGEIFFEGGLSPGNSPASVTYHNDVNFGASSTVRMELGGRAAGTEYDQLNIVGSLALDGVLHVTLLNDFLPAAGDQFDLLTATDGMVGVFDQVEYPALQTGLVWRLDYDQSAVRLSVESILDPSADFDGNGLIDGADLLIWQRGLGTASGATLAMGDANRDGAVDSADLVVWTSQNGGAVAAGMAASVFPGIGGSPTGDFNADGVADGADVLLWQRGLGTSSGALLWQGDGNRDGRVDGADLSLWRTQASGPSGSAGGSGLIAAPAPEPAAGWLAGAALFALAARVRRR